MLENEQVARIAESINAAFDYSALSAAIRGTLDANRAYLESIPRNMIEAVAQTARGYGSTLESVAGAMQEQVRQAAALRNELLPGIAAELTRHAQIVEAQRQYERTYRRYVEILTLHGWPPMLEVPTPALRQIVDEYDENHVSFAAEIDEAIICSHNEEVLTRILDRWGEDSLTRNRICILTDAVNAHIAGKYNLSVPALLAQIEGVVAEANSHKGKLSGAAFQNYVDRALSVDESHQPLRAVIYDEFYARFTWGDEVPNLSRHAILHGASIQYGTAKNSLKVILLLDLLVHLLARL